MATALYEPAFAIVGRAHHDQSARLRALGMVTLFGGLASTVFLPLTDALVRAAGWRAAVMTLALLLVFSTWIIHRVAPTRASDGHSRGPNVTPRRASTEAAHAGPPLSFLLLAFGFASLASAAVIANLVPALGDRAVTPTTAAAFGGMFGLMQLPGRAVMMRGRFPGSPFILLAGSLSLQALGLATWALIPSAVAAFAGIAVFAVGSGLTTLVRPYLVHSFVEQHEAGYLNGRLAQAQQLTRAAGPVLAAWAATAITYSAVLALLGVAFAALTAWTMLRYASSRDAGGMMKVVALDSADVAPSPSCVLSSGAESTDRR
jgi:hypothetical protein